MNTARVHLPETLSPDAAAVGALYQQLVAGWNARDADAFAAPFAEDGESIGFDGSQLSGRAEIAATLRGIFAAHPTGAYVGSVRGVRLIDPHAAVLRAVAGIVPAGSADIAPALNSIQRLVAARSHGEWRVVLFQNTPAQFHGRPELVQQLTEELRQLLT